MRAPGQGCLRQACGETWPPVRRRSRSKVRSGRGRKRATGDVPTSLPADRDLYVPIGIIVAWDRGYITVLLPSCCCPRCWPSGCGGWSCSASACTSTDPPAAGTLATVSDITNGGSSLEAARRPAVRAGAEDESAWPTQLGQSEPASSAAGPSGTTRPRPAKGKLFARERVDLLADAGSFTEDGAFANVLADGLPADGVITGTRPWTAGRSALMANDSDRQGGLLGRPHRRRRSSGSSRGPTPTAPHGLPGRLGRGADHRPGADVPRPARRGQDLPHPGPGLRARSRRCARCSGRRPRAAPTSRPSATS